MAGIETDGANQVYGSGLRPDIRIPDIPILDECRQLRRTLSRVDGLMWTACLLLSIFCLLSGELIRSPLVQWAPWIVGIFVMSLPHGGMDDFTPSLLRGEGMRRRGELLFYVTYLALVGLVVICWRLNADLGLFSFLLVSGYHFGQGDLYWSHLKRATPEGGKLVSQPGRSSRIALLLARGGVVVLLPFVYHDRAFLEIGARLSEESGQVITFPAWLVGHRGLVLILIGVLILGQIWFNLREEQRRVRAERDKDDDRGFSQNLPVFSQNLKDILETGILVILFLAAPPILSVGAYILCWHAPRHIWRLILLDQEMRGLVVRGEPLAALRLFHRRSLLIVIGAVAILLLISLFSIKFDFAPERLILPAFIFVNAITLPHILTVSRLDLFQQIWK